MFVHAVSSTNTSETSKCFSTMGVLTKKASTNMFVSHKWSTEDQVGDSATVSRSARAWPAFASLLELRSRFWNASSEQTMPSCILIAAQGVFDADNALTFVTTSCENGRLGVRDGKRKTCASETPP